MPENMQPHEATPEPQPHNNQHSKDIGHVSTGNTLVDSKLKDLDRSIASLTKSPDKPPEVSSEMPNTRAILEAIVGFGKLRDQITGASPEMNEELWKTYIDAIDVFRGSIGLPKIKDAGMSFTLQLTHALDRKDAQALWKIFAEEARVYNKPKRAWEKIKRIPGINFIAGILGGGGELAYGLGTLANEGRKAVGIASTDQEKEEAKKALAAVAESFKHLDKLVIAMTRSEEYKKSLQEEGLTTGYVLGKHYFDLALIVLGGKLVGHAGKAAAEASAVGASVRAAQSSIATAEAALEGSLEAAAKAGVMEGAEMALEAAAANGIKGALKKASGLMKHGGKEGAQEVAKEGIKHAPDSAAGGAH